MELKTRAHYVEAKDSHLFKESSAFSWDVQLGAVLCSVESRGLSTGRAVWKKSLMVLNICKNPDGIRTRSA